jgi:hypothetical protein
VLAVLTSAITRVGGAHLHKHDPTIFQGFEKFKHDPKTFHRVGNPKHDPKHFQIINPAQNLIRHLRPWE